MLHGILGSGQNLRAVAKRLVVDLPEWGFILPDLRHHGESHAEPGPDTIAGVVGDLEALAVSLGIAPKTAIGHSFGGKVALAWGEVQEAAGRPVDRVWALDVPPGLPDVPLALQSEVIQVFRALRSIPLPLPRRDSVVTALVERGFGLSIAQWMTTNVRPGEAGGFVWRFELDGIERLFESDARTDLWPWLESSTRRARVDVVRAGRSERWSAGELARFNRPNLHLHTLPDAGHWLHVDDPDGLHRRFLAEGLGP